MTTRKITTGGQISLPAQIRHRWGTHVVVLEDRGDAVIVRPLPDDPVAAARGALKHRIGSKGLRSQARRDEADAEARR